MGIKTVRVASHFNDIVGDRKTVKRPRLTMCLYDHFRPATADGHEAANQNEIDGNGTYSKNPAKFSASAAAKQKRLLRTFRAHADVVPVQADAEAGPDQVFTADGTFTLVIAGHHYTVISKFTNEKRQSEVDAQITAIKASDIGRGVQRTFIEMPFNFEGTGDAVYDVFRDVVWAGYNPNGASVKTADQGRSDIRAHRFLEQKLGVEFLSLPSKNPGYHVDTVLAPLSKGHMLVSVDVIDPSALEILKENAFRRFGMDPDEYLIPVTGDDAANYATNLRCFGDHIIMPTCSKALQETLENAGYKVTVVDLEEFLAAGGSGHCLSNNIDEERIIGGVAAILGLTDCNKKDLPLPIRPAAHSAANLNGQAAEMPLQPVR
jgi:N-dimethylarginine dimethylaminohydrolase